MQGKTIAILESRVGPQMADLVRKHGGMPLWAPALAEVPDLDRTHLEDLIAGWRSRMPDVFIFQTGVGTRALFAGTDELEATPELLRWLAEATVVARGPKPTAALRSRNVRIDVSAEDPFTTHEVLAALDAARPVRALEVVVQRYGDTNRELTRELESRGARVTEIATYRWSLPEDTKPLLDLIDALERDDVDVVAFTSGAQVGNLFDVAERHGRTKALRSGLEGALVASIGPVCSAALREFGVRVDIEARPPKLGPFIAAIDGAVSGRATA